MSIQAIKSLEKLIIDIKTEIGTDYEKAILLKQDLKDKKLLILLYKYFSHRTVIAGSYVLKILTDATWENNDIDIYTTDKNLLAIFKKMFIYVKKVGNGKYPGNPQCYYFLDDRNDISLNLIIVSVRTNIKDYIRKEFDIRCCECIFDGRTIEYNSYSINNKVMNGVPDSDKRKKKYIGRGYTLENKDIKLFSNEVETKLKNYHIFPIEYDSDSSDFEYDL